MKLINMAKDWGKDFDKKLKAKFGDDIVRLDPYVNKRTIIRFKHKCGNVYSAVPSGVLNSKVGSCTKCRNHVSHVRWTTESFAKKVKELVGDEYTFLEPYQGALTKIKCRHDKCGTEWMVKPNNFLNGTRCPNIDCIPKKPYKTQKQIDAEVKEKTNGKYEMVEPYQGDGTKVLFRHTTCGYEWKIKPNDILNGHGCPSCARCIRWTTEDYKQFIQKKYGDEYTLLSEYQSMAKPVKLRHNKCGNVYWAEAVSLKVGHKCKVCANKESGLKARITPGEFNKRVNNIFGDDYVVTGYTRLKDRVNAYHKKCGYKWTPRAGDLLSGYGCPFCKQSVGERTINLWLKRHLIKFEDQKRFDDCRDTLALPFDFYLPDYNLIIEYDGRQHFSGSDNYFGGEEAYKIRHAHDLIKNQYCHDNNINLLRIPYTVTGDAIGETIQKELDSLKVLQPC